MAKDILGQELEVGDYFVYTEGRTTQMFLAKVTEINGNRVYYETVTRSWKKKSYKSVDRCLKYPKTEGAEIHFKKMLLS